jgi:hypothetical protein
LRGKEFTSSRAAHQGGNRQRPRRGGQPGAVVAGWRWRVARRGGGSVEEGSGVRVESEGGTSGRQHLGEASGHSDVEEGGQGRCHRGGVRDRGGVGEGSSGEEVTRPGVNVI